MRKTVATMCLLLAAVGGCATAPMQRTVVNSFNYTQSIDTVWSATVETFAEMNLPIANMEKASGLITTDWINLTGTGNQEYCDCGGLGLAIEEVRQGKFNVFVKQVGAEVAVRVNCQFQQTANLGGNLFNRSCVSTGNLEARINNMIKSKSGG